MNHNALNLWQERLFLMEDDITTLEVEGIVNAANPSLFGGGGVDGAIHQAGGPEILEECRDIRRHRYPHGMPTGRAVLTQAGRLPSTYVIHTVGPVWEGGRRGEAQSLQEAYRNSLELASQTGIKSLAFPAISTGVYGFPKDQAAPLVFRTITAFLTAHSLPRKVYLVFFHGEDLTQFQHFCQSSDTLAGEGSHGS